MKDDPHDRCRFANDARLECHPDFDRIVWPCGLSVTITGPLSLRRRRYFLPELHALHDQARQERRTVVESLTTASRKGGRVARRMRKARNRGT